MRQCEITTLWLPLEDLIDVQLKVIADVFKDSNRKFPREHSGTINKINYYFEVGN